MTLLLISVGLAHIAFAAPRIDIETLTQSEAKRFEVKVQVLRIAAPTPAQARINAAIAAEARTQIADFVRTARKENTDLRYVWDLVLFSRVRLATDEWLSFTVTGGEFTGGAHPNPITTSRLFDMRTGKPMQLAHLFRAGAPYLETLAKHCRASVYRREDVRENAGWVETGLAPKATNYGVFYLDGKNLVVIFPPYQIAPYSSGAIEVRIPVQSLASIAAPEGPLATR